MSQGLAAMFCGPSKEPWSKVSFQTPQEALATFQAAVGRHDVDVVYQCLSHDMKLGVGGRMGAEIVWKKIQEKYPGIHVINKAKVIGEPKITASTASFDLEVAFQQFRVGLIREEFWEVVYLDAEGKPRHRGEPMPMSETTKVTAGETTEIRVKLMVDEEVHPEDISSIMLSREWRVHDFQPVKNQ